MRDSSSPEATTTGVESQWRTLLDSISMPRIPANQNLRKRGVFSQCSAFGEITEHSHDGDGDVLHVLDRVRVSSMLSKTLHPGVGDAVDEANERFDHFGGPGV